MAGASRSDLHIMRAHSLDTRDADVPESSHAQPTVVDLRESMNRGTFRRSQNPYRRSLTLSPGSPAANRLLNKTATAASRITSQQMALDEERAAQTMFLRRRQVSLEDTIPPVALSQAEVCDYYGNMNEAYYV